MDHQMLSIQSVLTSCTTSQSIKQNKKLTLSFILFPCFQILQPLIKLTLRANVKQITTCICSDKEFVQYIWSYNYGKNINCS